MRKSWYILALLLLAAPVWSDGRRYSEMAVDYTPNQIVIDGEFDPAWERVAPYELGNFDGSISFLIVENFLTTVRCLWDRDYLYVMFICDDYDIVSNFTKRDQPVYEQECCEVFLRIPQTAQMYEISVSPRGVVFDAGSRRDGMNMVQADAGWNAEGLKTAVKVIPSTGGKIVWRVEMAILWRSIGIDPQQTRELYGNLLRYELISNPRLRSANLLKVKPEYLALCLFPTHIPAWPSGTSSQGRIVLLPPARTK